MMHRLPGTGIAHVPEGHGYHVDVIPEIAGFAELVLSEHDSLVNVVAHPFFPHDAVHQNTGDGLAHGFHLLHRAVAVGGDIGVLHEPFVAGVGHVPGLVGHNLDPE